MKINKFKICLIFPNKANIDNIPNYLGQQTFRHQMRWKKRLRIKVFFSSHVKVIKMRGAIMMSLLCLVRHISLSNWEDSPLLKDRCSNLLWGLVGFMAAKAVMDFFQQDQINSTIVKIREIVQLLKTYKLTPKMVFRQLIKKICKKRTTSYHYLAFIVGYSQCIMKVIILYIKMQNLNYHADIKNLYTQLTEIMRRASICLWHRSTSPMMIQMMKILMSTMKVSFSKLIINSHSSRA